MGSLSLGICVTGFAITKLRSRSQVCVDAARAGFVRLGERLRNQFSD